MQPPYAKPNTFDATACWYIVTNNLMDESDAIDLTEEDFISEPIIILHESPVSHDAAVPASKKRKLEDLSADVFTPTTTQDPTEIVKDCPICMDAWTNEGDHRIVTLPCGHLFGKSCITEWLKNDPRKSCPQCNVRVPKKNGIIPLYTPNFIPLDTSVLNEMRVKLQVEGSKLKEAESRIASLLADNALLKFTLDGLEKSFKSSACPCSSATAKATGASSAASSYVLSVDDSSSISTRLPPRSVRSHAASTASACNFAVTTTVPLEASRVVEFAGDVACIFVSESLPPSHPSDKADVLSAFRMGDMRLREATIRLHKQPIRDMKWNRQSQLMLSVSFDKTAKLSSLTSKSEVLSYDLPARAWSCLWDSTKREQAYVGLADGSVMSFDIRNTREPLGHYTGWSRSPVSNLVMMPVDTTPDHDVLLAGSLTNMAMLRRDSTGIDDDPLFKSLTIEGFGIPSTLTSCPSLPNYVLAARRGAVSECCLFSNPGVLAAESPLNLQRVRSFDGFELKNGLSRSFIKQVSCNALRKLAICGAVIENRCCVRLWSVDTGEVLQDLPAHSSPILDTQCYSPQSGDGYAFVATLSPNRLDLLRSADSG